MNSAVEAAQAFLDENALVYIGVEDAAERLAESMRSAVRAEIAQELLEVSMARFPISPQVFDITEVSESGTPVPATRR